MTKHSFEIEIAVGRSKNDTNWRYRKVTWEKFKERCKKVKETGETVAQYAAMNKGEKGRVKDVGGFVGAILKDGRRRKESVEFRTLATLDIDFGTPDVWDDFTTQYDCAALLYPTHSYTKEKPRYRLVIPFSRRVKCEEYEPVCRRITASLGIDLFDDTTYEINRLFYWPSMSKDADYFLEFQDGEPLNPDDLLETYGDWSDCSEWPIGSKERERFLREAKEAKEAKETKDPRKRTDLIGAFCRTYYPIENGIEKFLSKVYEPTEESSRYTYVNGSTSGGLVCYEHLLAYSHHDTDPANNGHNNNIFDLVRIHLYGGLDKKRDYSQDITKAPSYKAMIDFVNVDEETKRLLFKERKQSIDDDFGDIEEQDDSWKGELDCDKKGNAKSTRQNCVTVLENDQRLKGHLAFNDFDNKSVVCGGLPWDKDAKLWRDEDSKRLRVYMEIAYGISGKDAINDARVEVERRHRFHPVRDYLSGLQWDGTPRLEHAIIDYVGAADCELTRKVTRIWLTAAVKRIFEPGCKMDYCLILVGAQGIGKSTFFEVMGGEWYNGNLSAMSNDRASLEQLQGSWIFELQELDGMKKREASQVKAFITNREDRYRGAYKEESEGHKRQCVFGGTTNEDTFLKDETGDRRFWPVQVDASLRKYEDTREALKRDRDQLWAEAVDSYRHGCQLWLSAGLEIEMENRRKSYSWTEEDPMPGYVEEYPETKLPADWDSYTTEGKVYYYKHEDEIRTKGIKWRMTAFPGEFITCYLGKDRACKEYQSVSTKFNRIMKNEHSVEWTQKMIPYQGGGFKSSRQKGWLRNEAPREDDPL